MKVFLSILILSSVTFLVHAQTSDTFMRHYDANGDNQISLDEYLAPTKAQFNQLDVDHDDKITPEEYLAYIEELKRHLAKIKQ